MTPKAASTQRFDRSSRSPALRLPDVKSAATTMATVASISAIRGGREKNALKPPAPKIASPKKAAVATRERNATRGVVMAGPAKLFRRYRHRLLQPRHGEAELVELGDHVLALGLRCLDQ